MKFDLGAEIDLPINRIKQYFEMIKDLGIDLSDTPNVESIKDQIKKMVNDMGQNPNQYDTYPQGSNEEIFKDLLDPKSFELENAADEFPENSNSDAQVKNKRGRPKGNRDTIEIRDVNDRNRDRKRKKGPFYRFDERSGEFVPATHIMTI